MRGGFHFYKEDASVMDLETVDWKYDYRVS